MNFVYIREHIFTFLIWLFIAVALMVVYIATFSVMRWVNFIDDVKSTYINQIQNTKKKWNLYTVMKDTIQDKHFWEYSINSNAWIYVLNWVDINKWIDEQKLEYNSDVWLFQHYPDTDSILTQKKLIPVIVPVTKSKLGKDFWQWNKPWYIIKDWWANLTNWNFVSNAVLSDEEKWFGEDTYFWLWYFKDNKEAYAFQRKYFWDKGYVLESEHHPMIIFPITSNGDRWESFEYNYQ